MDDPIEHALSYALAFFEYRDQMNAAIHVSDPCWSPITEVVRTGLNYYYQEVGANG